MLVPVNTLYVISYFQYVVVCIHLIMEVSVHYGELLQEWVRRGGRGGPGKWQMMM